MTSVRTAGGRSRRGVVVFTAVLVAALLQTAVAAAVPAADGVIKYQGHRYELVETLFESWDDANAAAVAMPTRKNQCAYLATISSPGEQAVVTELMAGSTVNAWLGAYQPPGELSLDQGWQWVTGEPWNYTNWAVGEPNDTPYGDYIAGSEQYLETYQGDGVWNDAPSPDLAGAKYIVVEYARCRRVPIEIVVQETVPDVIPGGGGPFVATGPAVDTGVICPSGDTINIALESMPRPHFTLLKVEKIFTCDDGTGTFEVKMRVKLFPSGDTTAFWRITGGTDDYSSLRGRGSLVGTPTGPGTIEDVYTGRVIG